MSEIGVLLDIGLGLTLLWIVFYLGWRPYRLDNVREKLFQLRSELFLLAADGEVSFSDPAYYGLRNRLNAVIRFAHTMTLTRVILYGHGLTEEYHTEFQAWQDAVDNLEPQQRQKLIDIDRRTAITIAVQIFTGSPILWLAATFYIPVTLLRSAMDLRPKETLETRAVEKLRVDVIEEQAVIAFEQSERTVGRQPLRA